MPRSKKEMEDGKSECLIIKWVGEYYLIIYKKEWAKKPRKRISANKGLRVVSLLQENKHWWRRRKRRPAIQVKNKTKKYIERER